MKIFRKLTAAAVAASLMIMAGAEASAWYLCEYDDRWGVYIATDQDTGEQYYYKEDTGEYFNYYVEGDYFRYYNDTSSGYIYIKDNISEDKDDVSKETSEDGSVQSHTQDEIRAKYVELGLDKEWKTEYSVKPSVKKPYSEGKLTDASLQQALNMLNFIRYTAGLSDNVVLDDSYNHYAQCASVVNAANGLMSHTPAKPSGMNDAMYQDGYKGASKSNLGKGYNSLPGSLVFGYMEDSDSRNISRLGHRRWLLNPSMKKTGFGYAEYHTATYVIEDDFDFGKSFMGDYVAWPPENMPMELYQPDEGRYAFSVSLGNSYDKESAYDAVVRVSSKKTGKSWTISLANNDETYFNVNDQNYGLNRCIIFDTGVLFECGDTVSVSISGLTKKTGESAEINYDVNFFSMFPSVKDCDISKVKDYVYTGKAIKPKPTVKYQGKKLTEGVDYTLKYSYNRRIGNGIITVIGKGDYSGSTEVYFAIKPKKQTISKLTAGRRSFTVGWKKLNIADFYMIQYSTSSSMKNAETVYAYGTDSSWTVSGLKSGKKYYVRVCTYMYDGFNPKGYITGAWSNVRSVTVK